MRSHRHFRLRWQARARHCICCVRKRRRHCVLPAHCKLARGRLHLLRVSRVCPGSKSFWSRREGERKKFSVVRDVGIVRNHRLTHRTRAAKSSRRERANVGIAGRTKSRARKIRTTIRRTLPVGLGGHPRHRSAGHLHARFLIQEINVVKILPIIRRHGVLMRDVRVQIPRRPPFETVPRHDQRFLRLRNAP